MNLVHKSVSSKNQWYQITLLTERHNVTKCKMLLINRNATGQVAKSISEHQIFMGFRGFRNQELQCVIPQMDVGCWIGLWNKTVVSSPVHSSLVFTFWQKINTFHNSPHFQQVLFIYLFFKCSFNLVLFSLIFVLKKKMLSINILFIVHIGSKKKRMLNHRSELKH